MDHYSDPAGTESWHMQIRWETNSKKAGTWQRRPFVISQQMMKRLRWVVTSSLLTTPLRYLERERTEGRKREKFYICLDVTHTHPPTGGLDSWGPDEWDESEGEKGMEFRWRWWQWKNQYLTGTGGGKAKEEGRSKHQHNTPGPERANPGKGKRREKRRPTDTEQDQRMGGDGSAWTNLHCETYAYLSTHRTQPTWRRECAWKIRDPWKLMPPQCSAGSVNQAQWPKSSNQPHRQLTSSTLKLYLTRSTKRKACPEAWTLSCCSDRCWSVLKMDVSTANSTFSSSAKQKVMPGTAASCSTKMTDRVKPEKGPTVSL